MRILQRVSRLQNEAERLENLYPGETGKEAVEAMKERATILKLLARLESQMSRDFDPILSRKIDAVQLLLDSQKTVNLK